MSDQKEIETSRYARKKVEVRGLAQGAYDPNAKAIMAEHGVMWDLHGHINDLETTTVINRKVVFNGEEAPTTMSSKETEWLEGFCERNGIDIGITETEIERVPGVPYMNAPVRFGIADGEWTESKDNKVGYCLTKVELSRCSGILTLTIEGTSKDDVADAWVDNWIQGTVIKVREALKLANFTEAEELEIDCEVIMGAEREAKCDPDLMRSLLTTDQDGEEE